MTFWQWADKHEFFMWGCLVALMIVVVEWAPRIQIHWTRKP